VGDAVQKSFGEAVRQQNLRVAGYPAFEVTPRCRRRGGIPVQRHLRGVPEVVVGDCRRPRFTRPQAAGGEAEVDRPIEIMRKQRSTSHAARRPRRKAIA
jgi:trigger factor